MIEANSLHLGDCLDVMSEIPDMSIDAIIADLPFGTTYSSWDKQIPIIPLWTQYKRIIKDNGAILLFSAQPFTSLLVTSNLPMFRYEWCWKKNRGTGHLNAKNQPMRDKEDICVFYKHQPTYNPQFDVGIPYTTSKGGNATRVVETGDSPYWKHSIGPEYRNKNDGFRYPKQIIEFGMVEGKTLHRNQKPTDLLEYLIKTYTNEGDVVLDNTMGSGSTIVAAINTNRKFIGIEKERVYFEISTERMIGAMI